MKVHISLICLIASTLLTLSFTKISTKAAAAAASPANCKMYVPNAFSPNGDGVNDLFQPYSNCTLENFEMKIFDRWGTLLFQTQNADTGWNGMYRGQEAESTAYLYYIQYKMAPQSDSMETFQEVMTGNFALLR
jgi:gliding motility-associated-like protein